MCRMKKIKILKANWKCKIKPFKEPMNITTAVIKQGKYIVDPSDNDFISAIIKTYAKTKSKNTKFTLEIDHAELFYFAESSLSFILNLIYMDLFKSDKKPFEALLKCDDGDVYNVGLFSIETKQVKYLIKILKKLDISLKYILSKYVVLSFPKSLDSYDKNKLFDFTYDKIYR